MAFTLAIAGCGGGGSSTGSGGSSDASGTTPENIAGSYSGAWQGNGTNASGPFICAGEFSMMISQSGSVVTATLALVTGSGECNDFFNSPGSGSYLASNGEMTITLIVGDDTVTIIGTAMEQDGNITFTGRWSSIVTASGNVVASGTWTAASN